MFKKMVHPRRSRSPSPVSVPAVHPPSSPRPASPLSMGLVHVTAGVVGSGPAPFKTVRNSIYRGGLINNAIRDGVGVCKWEDGNCYDGEWKGAYGNGRTLLTLYTDY